MKKEERGKCFSTISEDEKIAVLKWVDNSVVMVASTAYGVAPSSNVKRYSKKQSKIIQVTQPHAIFQYNKHMGGTDRMDEDINSLRIGE
jgi:hypothetical protein